jgi:potassium channel subfamily K, other eukaryote
LSNVLSIAALVSPWRVSLPNNGELPEGADDNGIGIDDPRWFVSLDQKPNETRRKADRMVCRELILNGCSLACGFAGNFFLLLNFTGRVRYIVSLPLSIIFWFLACGIVSPSHFPVRF